MSERLALLLDDQGTVLWQRYLELEHRGVRERSL
jgi:hypothetical protein